MKLFHYWRSSASYRVRFALNWKGLACELVHLNLLTGESETPEHRKRNPMGYVPVLETEQGYLAESLAIIQWLEDKYPEPTLIPRDPWLKARAWMLAEIINAGTQPLVNLNPAQLHSDDPAEQKRWTQHWIQNGLHAYETLVAPTAHTFSMGETLLLPDICLIPQVYGAIRNEVDLSAFPTVKRIYENALKTPACQKASPEAHKPPDF